MRLRGFLGQLLQFRRPRLEFLVRVEVAELLVDVAAGPLVPRSTTCPGTLWALNPADGSFRWQDCLSFDARGGVMAVPGLVEVGLGASFSVYDTMTGNQLFTFQDVNRKSNFEGPGSISNGVLYHGNLDGHLYAFGP